MSRTYRGRHLPSIRNHQRGSALKYTEKHIRFSDRDEELWQYLAHTLNNYPCSKSQQITRWSRSCRNCMHDLTWSESWDMFAKVLQDDVRPVAGLCFHPWAKRKFSIGKRAKTYFKFIGNKTMRKYNKNVLRHLLMFHHFGDANASSKSFMPLKLFVDRWSWD